MFARKQTKKSDNNDLRSRASNKSQFNYYSTTSQHARPSDTTKEMQSVNLGSIRHRLRLVPTFAALSIIAVSLLISLTLSSRPSVSLLNNKDSPYRNLDEYAIAAEVIMSQDLSSKTKLSIDTSNIERQFIEQFPELKAAVLRLPVLGRKPSLILDINSPVILLATQTKSYVLDSSGTVVSDAQALASSERAGLLVVQDQSGLVIEVGKQAVTTQTIRFITDITAQLKAKNLNISQLTLPQSANQLDIRIEGTRYFVKTDVAGSARLQIGGLIAVKSQLEGKGENPSEYIDVRVEGKVFYK